MPEPEQSQDFNPTRVPDGHSKPVRWGNPTAEIVTDGEITAHIRTISLRREAPTTESLSISFITSQDFRPAAIAELLDSNGCEHFLIRPPVGPFDMKDVNNIAWYLFDAFEARAVLVREKISKTSLVTPMDSATFDVVSAGKVGLILERPESDFLRTSLLPDRSVTQLEDNHNFPRNSANLIRYSSNHCAEWAVIRAESGFTLIVAPRDIAHGQRISLTFGTDDVALQEIIRAGEAIGISDEGRSLNELRDIFARSLGWVRFDRPGEGPHSLYSPILQMTKDLFKLPVGCIWHSDMPSNRVSFNDFYKMSRGCEFFCISLPSTMDNTISELRGWMGKDKRCFLEVRNPTLNNHEAKDQGSIIEFAIQFKGPAQSIAHHLLQVVQRFVSHSDKLNFVSALMREYDFKVPRANDPSSTNAEHEALALCAAGDLISKFEALSNTKQSKFQPVVSLTNLSSGVVEVLFTGRAGATLSFMIQGRTIISGEISTSNMFVGRTSEAHYRSSRYGNHRHTVSEIIQAFRDISWIESLLPARFTTVVRLMKEGFY